MQPDTAVPAAHVAPGRRVSRLGMASLALALALPPAVLAEASTALPVVEVRASSTDLGGLAIAGSEGIVSGQRLARLPVLRPAEALETVPGLIVTQHAGDGKANQYFLRGFNLDHGTDFATSVAGVPVNMPTHAHGQGYLDLNFLIPELVDRIVFRKGPYFAEEGDFASAGAAHIDYARHLKDSLAQLTLAPNGYVRSLLAASPEVADGRLLYGLELFHNDGPWEVDANYRKLNGVLRYSRGTAQDGFALTGMAYQGRWTSSDQIPWRAVADGSLGRFASLDPTSGGRSWRYSLSGAWAKRGEAMQQSLNLWWLQSGLDLWSNFQYCLNDLAANGNCATGDQFKQAERRQAGGLALAQSRFGQWGGFDVENAFGLQTRIDRLQPVGLYASQGRSLVATVREDRVTQRSLGLWAKNETRWTPWFRSVQGLRADFYDFTVDAGLPANLGRADDRMLTPKLALIFGPWGRTEFFVNYGHGFHSNDARGTTQTADPVTGTGVDGEGNAVRRLTPLVRTRGREIGVRTPLLPGWQTTLALWQLDAASELLFVGDAGTTEASRPSRRQGIEWTHAYALSDVLTINADFAWSKARFRDPDASGQYIPGAVTHTANVALSLNPGGRWSGSLRLRHIGPRPLTEDNAVRSQASTLAYLRLGYQPAARTQLLLDVFNLFDRKANDIEYWYESRLAGEPAAVADRHVHPAEPRTLRLTLVHRF